MTHPDVQNLVADLASLTHCRHRMSGLPLVVQHKTKTASDAFAWDKWKDHAVQWSFAVAAEKSCSFVGAANRCGLSVMSSDDSRTLEAEADMAKPRTTRRDVSMGLAQRERRDAIQ